MERWVEVYIEYAKHKNVLPAELAALAAKHKMEYDGGGMAIGGTHYGHQFLGWADNAKAFANAVHAELRLETDDWDFIDGRVA